MDDSTSTEETGTQKFIENLFSTGASAIVDSQYARNYQPNDPHNFNAGRPAGVSTAYTLTSNPLFLIGAVAAVGLLVYLIARK